MFWGPAVLVSMGRLVQLPTLFACASLPRLVFAGSATPFRPYYRRLGLQFAVGENISTGRGQSHRSLHLH